EAVLLRFGVELGPGEAGLGPRDSLLRVDLDSLHTRQIDDDALIDGGVPRHVVRTAAEGNGHSLRSREGERGFHVGDARALRDERGALVDGAVPDLARFFVALVAGGDEGACESFD